MGPAQGGRAAQARPLRPPRPAGYAARTGAGACGCLDPDSSPGRLAPVAAVTALGPDLPDMPGLPDLLEPSPTYGPRTGRLGGSALPRGFFLDRYVY